ncbi:MAG: sulfide/dihydroorotate dehydrogenase-like FAD/NAD-binding protein [Candidatus Omnitrophica bacterium]|nr:sulfide/dihydroorotate dehydrogenase-like FAD/NAD-binding protein [Candidatus Omnitrophota bacterium]
MRILEKEHIAENLTKFIIDSPLIAQKALPGQFIVLMVRENGERIPLTIVEADKKKKTITIIFQEVGYTTKILGKLAVGESLYSLTGPLGKPTPIKNYGKVIVLGGGVGIAELLPIAKALKQKGNHISTILGVKTKGLLILEQGLRAVSDEFYITTDDGSYGKKGFTVDILKDLLTKYEILNTKYELVYCVGPIPMMRAVSELTRPFKIKTIVCLNSVMIDGTGMCGCCRVTVAGAVKFTCVDGPDFDGHLVDFNELTIRQKRFLEHEKESICKLDEQLLIEKEVL